MLNLSFYRICFYTFLSLFIQSCNSSAQTLPPVTTWEGNLMGVRFILKVNKDSSTKETIATFDSPDQNALGFPVSKLVITNDSLLA